MTVINIPTTATAEAKTILNPLTYIFLGVLILGVIGMIWCKIALWKNNKYHAFMKKHTGEWDHETWKFYFNKWEWYVDWPWHRLPKAPKQEDN